MRHEFPAQPEIAAELHPGARTLIVVAGGLVVRAAQHEFTGGDGREFEPQAARQFHRAHFAARLRHRQFGLRRGRDRRPTDPLRHLADALRALGRILGQAGGQHLFPDFRDRRPGHLEVVAAASQARGGDRLHLHDEVARVKRRLTRQQFVEGRPEGIDVVRDRRLFPQHLLRAHVGRCARAAAGLGRDPRNAVADAPGDAEIRDLHPAVRIDHDVGRLEVVVHHARLVVRVVERRAQLRQPVGHVRRLEKALGAIHAQLRQRHAVHCLHGDGGHQVVLEEIVDANDARMGELARALGLAFQVIERRGVELHDLGQEFQGEFLVELLVVRKPHHAHAAAPEDFFQQVTAKDLLARGKTLDRRA